MIDKITDIVYKTLTLLTVAVFIFIVILIGSVFVKKAILKNQTIQNHRNQLKEIYQNQVYLRDLLETYQELNFKYTTSIAEDTNTRLKKPSYDYLKSVTVYMVTPQDIIVGTSVKGQKASVGTGTIVKQRDGYSYILTNKHICDVENKDLCYIALGAEPDNLVKLEYVDRVEADYDLSLWRTNKKLPGKRAIKGLSTVFRQERIFSVGNYLGSPFVYTEGTYGGKRDNDDILNASCAFGCSGSGVFNSDGELVSVVFAGSQIGVFQVETAKILGVSSDVIRLFLKDLLED